MCVCVCVCVCARARVTVQGGVGRAVGLSSKQVDRIGDIRGSRFRLDRFRWMVKVKLWVYVCSRTTATRDADEEHNEQNPPKL